MMYSLSRAGSLQALPTLPAACDLQVKRGSETTRGCASQRLNEERRCVSLPLAQVSMLIFLCLAAGLHVLLCADDAEPGKA